MRPVGLSLGLGLVLAGCITSVPGPTTIDIYNSGSQIVKVFVALNFTTNGSLLEQQVYVIGPANVDEKNVASTNVTEALRLDAWTETGLHLAAPLDVRANGMAVDLRFNDSTMTGSAHGR